MRTAFNDFFYEKRGIYGVLHVMILLLSLFLIVDISIDTFNNIPFISQTSYLKTQFWICMFFIADFIFLLVSIPYLNIINYYDFTFSAEVTYFLRFIPLVRSGWALAIVVGWLTSNRASGLFVSYLTMLLAMVYFSSLIFFVIEQKVNPEVKDYNDALWWAFMDVTTVGSNIIAITPTGRILSVLLAALGMMMFPIFTVYVTSLVQSANKKKEDYYNQTHPVSSGQASEAKPAGSTQTDK